MRINFTESWYNLGWGDSWWFLVQHPGQSRVSYSRLLTALSSSVLSISKDGVSTASLGTLFQCLTTLTGKKIFPWISLEIPVFQPEDVFSHPNSMHLQGEPGFSKSFH